MDKIKFSILKMYPNGDFRCLVNQKNCPESTLIRTLAREPFPEILQYWSQTEKPGNLFNIYYQGIEDGISRDRYPLYQLRNIEPYPEFWGAVLNGLEKLWSSLRFSLNSESLLIDSIYGQTVAISLEDKLQILHVMRNKMNLEIRVNDQTRIVDILSSKRAEHIYQKVHWLEKLMVSTRK